MTDTQTSSPVPGWYPDPTGASSYRLWDGAHWTQNVLDEPAGAAASAASASAPRAIISPRPGCSRAHEASGVLQRADADGTLPSRRSLRDAAAHGSTPGQVASPVPAPQYVPVNPLTGRSGGVGRPATGAARFVAPTAWQANAPAPPPPYWQATPGKRPFPVAKAINRSARNGFALGILSLLIAVGIAVATLVTGRVWVVYSFWGVAGLIWSIVGLVKANRWDALGFEPLARKRAIAGVVLCSLALLGQGAEAGLALATSQAATSTRPHVAAPASGTAPGGPAGFAAAPQVGVIQGDGSYAYSQQQAEAAISNAYFATINVRPSSVTCPQTETLAVSVSFSCSVTALDGTNLTAQVTIVDDEGHAEVNVQ